MYYDTYDDLNQEFLDADMERESKRMKVPKKFKSEKEFSKNRRKQRRAKQMLRYS